MSIVKTRRRRKLRKMRMRSRDYSKIESAAAFMRGEPWPELWSGGVNAAGLVEQVYRTAVDVLLPIREVVAADIFFHFDDDGFPDSLVTVIVDDLDYVYLVSEDRAFPRSIALAQRVAGHLGLKGPFRRLRNAGESKYISMYVTAGKRPVLADDKKALLAQFTPEMEQQAKDAHMGLLASEDDWLDSSFWIRVMLESAHLPDWWTAKPKSRRWNQMLHFLGSRLQLSSHMIQTMVQRQIEPVLSTIQNSQKTHENVIRQFASRMTKRVTYGIYTFRTASQSLGKELTDYGLLVTAKKATPESEMQKAIASPIVQRKLRMEKRQ